MKKAAAYFSGTILKRDITRFSPVWGSYTVLLAVMLVQLCNLDSGENRVLYIVQNLYSELRMLVVIQAIYGLLCGMVLFSDLFRPKLCRGLHALPLRREGWYLTHLASAALFFLVPTGLFSGILCAITGQWWIVGGYFLLISGLLFLFFFATAVLSVMCAGNVQGTVTVYGMLHLFAVFLWLAVKGIYAPYLYGIDLSADVFTPFSPAVYMLDKHFIQFIYHSTGSKENFYVVLQQADIRYLSILGGIGLLLLPVSGWMFCRRRLETAGDFLAVRWLRPVFTALFSGGAGVLVYTLAEAALGESWILLLIAAVAVSFFGGRMLLERTVRVFRLKNCLGLVLLLGMLGLSVLGMKADVLGIVRWIPDPENISQIQLTTVGRSDIPAVLEAEGDIQKILELHARRLDARETAESWEDVLRLKITYRLEDGREVQRIYVTTDRADSDLVEPYLSDWRCVFGVADPEVSWEQVKQTIPSIIVESVMVISGGNLLDSERLELLDAIYADCQAGVMGQDRWFFLDSDISYHLTLTGIGRGIRIDEDCANTLAVLTKIAQRQQRFPE